MVMVGEAVDELPRDFKGLKKSEGESASLKTNEKFLRFPHLWRRA